MLPTALIFTSGRDRYAILPTALIFTSGRDRYDKGCWKYSISIPLVKIRAVGSIAYLFH
jgi:hypothetical protein